MSEDGTRVLEGLEIGWYMCGEGRKMQAGEVLAANVSLCECGAGGEDLVIHVFVKKEGNKALSPARGTQNAMAGGIREEMISYTPENVTGKKSTVIPFSWLSQANRHAHQN